MSTGAVPLSGGCLGRSRLGYRAYAGCFRQPRVQTTVEFCFRCSVKQFFTSPTWQRSVTQHIQTEAENASLQTTVNAIRRRWDVWVVLTPRYKCQDLLRPTYLKEKERKTIYIAQF